MSTSSATPVPLALLGATGRMGREVLRALAGDPRFALTGATCSAASTLLGQDVSQIEKGLPPVRLCADAQEALEGARVAVDFSLPAATPSHLAACERGGAGAMHHRARPGPAGPAG